MKYGDFDLLKDSPEDLLKAAVSADFMTYEKAFSLLDEEASKQATKFINCAAQTKNVYYQPFQSRSKSKKYFKLYTVTEDYRIKQLRPSIYKFLEKTPNAIEVVNKLSPHQTGFYSVAEIYLCKKFNFDTTKDCVEVDARSSLTCEYADMLIVKKVMNYLNHLVKLSNSHYFSFKELDAQVNMLNIF
jgi:hypothetical protein